MGEEMNSVAWGLGYKIVTHTLGAFALEKPQDAESMQNIIDALFSAHPVRKTRSVTTIFSPQGFRWSAKAN